MPSYYADAYYYIALLMPTDEARGEAMRISKEIERSLVVTSDPVLTEVLAYFSARGANVRQRAVALVDGLRADEGVVIIRQTPALFDAGFELYRNRPDKGYSLTVCISMTICRQRKITHVLTHDRHFAQEGFEILF